MKYALVEKKNHLAVHGYFDSLESAKQHLEVTIPIYIQRRYFMDKTLTADSFEIIEDSRCKQRQQSMNG